MSVAPKLVGRVEPRTQFGRFSVYRRTDGPWIVYDPELAIARRTVSVHETKLEASDACRAASDAATARGEPNDADRKGWKLDWGDPKTWEKTA